MRPSNKFKAYCLFILLLLNPVVSPLVAAFSFFSVYNAEINELYKKNKKRKNKVFNISKTAKVEHKYKDKKQRNFDFGYLSVQVKDIVSAFALHKVVFNRFLYFFTARLFILQCKLII